MYTIKDAALRAGVSESSLRAWERRYGVVSPTRTSAGYRLYDDAAIAALAAMRGLVEEGWPASAAAQAVVSGTPVTRDSSALAGLTREFLAAAGEVDVVAVEGVLDRAFATSSFEAVVDGWLMPALTDLGRAWARGDVDVSGEHAASHVVMRRLSSAFAAAAQVLRGPRVVVGLPPGSRHELGALAFATAVRRRGLAVVYLGADLPVASWQRALRAFPTRAVVLAVATPDDREPAAETVRAVLDVSPDLLVAVGGAASRDVAPGVLTLPHSIPEAARMLDRQLT